MADTLNVGTLTRQGAFNDGANKLQLFKTQVVGEVLKTFDENDKLSRFQRVRKIASGKSAVFPFIGNIGGAYHTPGAPLAGAAGTVIKQAEKIISVDGQYISHTWISNLDEVMSSYDLRSEYTQQLGRALARAYQKRLARVMVRAARTQGPLDPTSILDETKNWGSTGAAPAAASFNGYNANLAGASMETTASVLTNAIWRAVEVLDTKNVPEQNRFVLIKPAQYYLLLNSGGTATTLALNRDYSSNPGDYARGLLPTIAGCEIVKSNYLPNGQDFTAEAFSAINPGVGTYAQTMGQAAGSEGLAETYIGNNYNGDFRNTVALVGQGEAVATVQLLDLQTEMEYYAMNQATLLLAKFAQGHGILRPECMCELTNGRMADGDVAKFLPTGG
jgi:hypothetical protein